MDFLNTISNLQQFMMFFNDFFNLVLVSMNIIKPSHGRTRLRGFFSTVRVVSVTTSMLIMNFLCVTFSKFSVNFQGSYFFKMFFRKSNSVSHLAQLEHIKKHQ